MYYENITEQIIKKYKLKNINIKFKNQNKGWSRLSGSISIPLWAKEKGNAFFLYYIIHELVHQIIYKKYSHWKHNKDFKRIERKILREYNLEIKYARAYPKALINKQGKEVYRDK